MDRSDPVARPGRAPIPSRRWPRGDGSRGCPNDPSRRHDEGRPTRELDLVPVETHDDVLRLGERDLEALPVEGLPLTLLERPAVEELARRRCRPDLHPRASLARAADEVRGPLRVRREAGGRIRRESGDLLTLRAAELPRCDHERRCHGDGDERDRSEAGLTGCPVSSRRRDAASAQRRVVLADREAGVVLVDERLAVEAQCLGVRAEKSADVRWGREDVETLVLEGPEVLRTNLRPLLQLGEVEVLTETSLAEAGADVEHAGGIVDALSRPLFAGADVLEQAVHTERYERGR